MCGPARLPWATGPYSGIFALQRRNSSNLTPSKSRFASFLPQVEKTLPFASLLGLAHAFYNKHSLCPRDRTGWRTPGWQLGCYTVEHPTLLPRLLNPLSGALVAKSEGLRGPCKRCGYWVLILAPPSPPMSARNSLASSSCGPTRILGRATCPDRDVSLVGTRQLF